jgi:hypothetical protein
MWASLPGVAQARNRSFPAAPVKRWQTGESKLLKIVGRAVVHKGNVHKDYVHKDILRHPIKGKTHNRAADAGG